MSDASPCPREAFEAAQRAWLASYAALADADTTARRHGEADHPYRSAFQRDRDRIIHCTAFRRLDFKTQVFVPHENDHSRTRLTHSLEVAQVGRTLGRALRLNEDLIETVALAHDLGHPPFGHGGEAMLDELMAGQGGFEHNRQSLRVVDYLEHPYSDFRGLNLTRAVRECLARHRTRYDHPAGEEFDRAVSGPLEGQIVDLADEMAYTSADLEDAFNAGWLTVEQIEHLELWRMALASARRHAPHAGDVHIRIRAAKAVLSLMADDAIAATASALAGAGIRTLQDIRRTPGGEPLAVFSPAMRSAVNALQDFLLKNVYLHPLALAQDRVARGMIRDLFNAYLQEPALLPERYRRRIDEQGAHRVVCDYIAGMTDRFCRQAHERLPQSL